MSSGPGTLYRLIRPLLFALEPEAAQSFAMAALAVREPLGRGGAVGAGAPVQILGMTLQNRIGLAAGFDKDARYVDRLARLGFGFLEVGTVTPRPQPGNPPPRVFRLVEDGALVNRMGFPNGGAEAAARRLEQRRSTIPCGVNIGKNRDTPIESAARDYVECLRVVYPVADYVTVNVSSPNTPGLRALQGGEALKSLLGEVMSAREQLQGRHARRVPVLVKLAPDLEAADIEPIVRELGAHAVDGIIATNTTTTRPAALRSRAAAEQGGLSGRPLLVRSLEVVRALRTACGPQLPIVGVGGLSDGPSARQMRAAGADLLQLYTGLVFEGPGCIARLAAAGAAFD